MTSKNKVAAVYEIKYACSRPSSVHEIVPAVAAAMAKTPIGCPAGNKATDANQGLGQDVQLIDQDLLVFDAGQPQAHADTQDHNGRNLVLGQRREDIGRNEQVNQVDRGRRIGDGRTEKGSRLPSGKTVGHQVDRVEPNRPQTIKTMPPTMPRRRLCSSDRRPKFAINATTMYGKTVICNSPMYASPIDVKAPQYSPNTKPHATRRTVRQSSSRTMRPSRFRVAPACSTCDVA